MGEVWVRRIRYAYSVLTKDDDGPTSLIKSYSILKPDLGTLRSTTEPLDPDLYNATVALVARDRKATTSHIQRNLSIGYNCAARLIDRMEQEGLIGPVKAGGKREIFLPSDITPSDQSADATRPDPIRFAVVDNPPVSVSLSTSIRSEERQPSLSAAHAAGRDRRARTVSGSPLGNLDHFLIVGISGIGAVVLFSSGRWVSALVMLAWGFVAPALLTSGTSDD